MGRWAPSRGRPWPASIALAGSAFALGLEAVAYAIAAAAGIGVRVAGRRGGRAAGIAASIVEALRYMSAHAALRRIVVLGILRGSLIAGLSALVAGSGPP